MSPVGQVVEWTGDGEVLDEMVVVGSHAQEAPQLPDVGRGWPVLSSSHLCWIGGYTPTTLTTWLRNSVSLVSRWHVALQESAAVKVIGMHQQVVKVHNAMAAGYIFQHPLP